jgi:sodium/hydrogen antiporter
MLCLPVRQVALIPYIFSLTRAVAVVYFLVLTSIIVHGLSIPVLSAIYKYCGAKTITDDSVIICRRSMYEPTPSNACKGDQNTFIAYNRFFRPLAANLSILPIAHTMSRDEQCSPITELGDAKIEIDSRALAEVDLEELPSKAGYVK